MCLKKVFSRKCKNKVEIGKKGAKALNTEMGIYCNHIFRDVINADQKSVGGYAVVHGFEQSDCWWIGVDLRWCGIPIADVVIKFKTRKLYDEYIHLLQHGDQFHTGPSLIANKVRDDKRLNCTMGDDMDTEFTFYWDGDDKDFHVHLMGDRYAEEK